MEGGVRCHRRMYLKRSFKMSENGKLHPSWNANEKKKYYKRITYNWQLKDFLTVMYLSCLPLVVVSHVPRYMSASSFNCNSPMIHNFFFLSTPMEFSQVKWNRFNVKVLILMNKFLFLLLHIGTNSTKEIQTK